MNRFLPLIRCAFVGILVSSCARNPPSVVPKTAYGSTSGTSHRSAKHHHVALAQVPLRHPRAASEGHRRQLAQSLRARPKVRRRPEMRERDPGRCASQAGVSCAWPEGPSLPAALLKPGRVNRAFRRQARISTDRKKPRPDRRWSGLQEGKPVQSTPTAQIGNSPHYPRRWSSGSLAMLAAIRRRIKGLVRPVSAGKEMAIGMTKRWMAEITYRNGDAPMIVQFEELADLHDIVELGADWNVIEQIVITRNRSSATPRREEMESGL